MSRDRDRTTVRRALRAAAIAGVLVVALLLSLVVTGNSPGGAVIAMAAIAVASLVAAGWLVLATFLDVLAGEPPGGRRIAWTIGAVLLAMLGPFLVVGAATQSTPNGIPT